MNKLLVAIIGAGLLGSRHLQGILASKYDLQIFVIDPSSASLELAKQRAEEIEYKHEVNYFNTLDVLPKNLDLVIIATNSNVRSQVITKLLSKTIVRYLILEKVLFQSLEEYDSIGKLIIKHGVTAWVNHPRRAQNLYKNLRTTLATDDLTNSSFSVYGQNWGLGCNGLHFLDLIIFLAGSQVKTLQTLGLDNHIFASKREGFIEFSGTLSGNLQNGAKFTITSVFNSNEEILPITVTVNTPKRRYLILEGASSVIVSFADDDNFKLNVTEDKLLFQSELSTIILESILVKDTCDLPTYEEAKNNHEIFISSLLSFYNKSLSEDNIKCPIT